MRAIIGLSNDDSRNGDRRSEGENRLGETLGGEMGEMANITGPRSDTLLGA